jgi:hypothetical protein
LSAQDVYTQEVDEVQPQTETAARAATRKAAAAAPKHDPTRAHSQETAIDMLKTLGNAGRKAENPLYSQIVRSAVLAPSVSGSKNVSIE